jgi:nucleotide-binding universal stress UspA family protein
MGLPPKRIVAAVDFTPSSLGAVDYGISLTQRFEAQFYLFHSLFGPQDALHNIDISRRPQSIARQTERTRNRMEELMVSSPVSWQPLICSGPPVETIAEEAERLQADLVLAAGQGLPLIQKLFLGRIVDPMARTLDCPMLIIRNGVSTSSGQASRVGFKRVLVATDVAHSTDSASDPVVACGACLARAYGAEVHLLQALERPLDETAVNPTGAPYSEVQEALFRHRIETLGAQIPPEVEDVCDVVTVVRPGPPGEVLKSYCREIQPDLIAVGVRPRGLLKKLVIGSTTEAVLHQRQAHVLTVPLVAS